MPELPMVTKFGLAFAIAITSWKLFGAKPGEPTTISGMAVVWISGAKSLSGS